MAVVILALTAMGAATAQSLERFRLFDYCQPMVIVEGLSSEAAGIGLTEQSIQNVMESRLRSARLYDPDANTIMPT